ncbi:hypothetical protein, partial [Archangium sp.]|uniref:hypothetical protein n=1 Tax=Archangium sp. TaxID=1872627 RepID=UPI002ED8B793
GYLYNSRGQKFDTTAADPSAVGGGGAAIFVMDTAGNIYASNAHPTTILRQSSFLAGRPVAAAGELKAVQGVITVIKNCSGPYQTAPYVTRQVLLSLNNQGYKGTPTYTMDCGPE